MARCASKATTSASSTKGEGGDSAAIHSPESPVAEVHDVHIYGLVSQAEEPPCKTAIRPGYGERVS